MAYERVEVITGETRRRSWSAEEKRRVLGEALQPGAVVSEIARRHGVCKSLVFRWRRQAHEGLLEVGAINAAPPGGGASGVASGEASAPATVDAAPAENAMPASAGYSPTSWRTDVMEIELRDGRRVRVDRHVDTAALKRVLAILEGR